MSWSGKRQVVLLRDDIDRHGWACRCGLCNSAGHSYGVGIYDRTPGGTLGTIYGSAFNFQDVVERFYGATPEAAMQVAQEVCRQNGWEVIPNYEGLEEEYGTD